MNEDKDQRVQRLAAALRANLGRRKQQSRQRSRAQRSDAHESTEAESGKPGMDRPSDES